MRVEYTPSTDEVRDLFAGARGGYTNAPRYERRGAGFDRWLTKHDRQVAERAWDEAMQALAWASANGPEDSALDYVVKNNPYRSTESEETE